MMSFILFARNSAVQYSFWTELSAIFNHSRAPEKHNTTSLNTLACSQPPSKDSLTLTLTRNSESRCRKSADHRNGRKMSCIFQLEFSYKDSRPGRTTGFPHYILYDLDVSMWTCTETSGARRNHVNPTDGSMWTKPFQPDLT